MESDKRMESVSPLNEHQTFERDWWGNCTNTFSEEAKQLTYAEYMGLQNQPDEYASQWPIYDLHGKSVLDIGGGPVSMLLKTFNAIHPAVVDPCPYPAWTQQRYTAAGIALYRTAAEHFELPRTLPPYDEVWIYNVLQHVEDPAACLATARRHAHPDGSSNIRIFEWVNTPPSLGHPHTIMKHMIDEALVCDGAVTYVSKNGAVGLAYYGVYPLLPLPDSP